MSRRAQRTGGDLRRAGGLAALAVALLGTGSGLIWPARAEDPDPCRPDPFDNGEALARAVAAANESGSESTILLQPGCTYTLRNTLVIRGRRDANQQPIPITIQGRDAVIERRRAADPKTRARTRGGPRVFRIFDVEAGGVLNLETVQVRGGWARADDGGGAALRVASTARVTVTRSTLTRNSSGEGAALANFGDAKLIDSTVEGNRSGAAGSVLWNVGILRLQASTVSGNRGDGGATIRNNGIADVVRSTVATNAGYARALENNLQLSVLASTIAANEGGGILDRADARIVYSIVANHTDVNCAGDPVDAVKILSTDASCTGVVSSVTLGSLRRNGGPTRTMALRPNSSGVNPGPCAIPNGSSASDFDPDQRGVARDLQCDIGAFERVDQDNDGYDDLTEMP